MAARYDGIGRYEVFLRSPSDARIGQVERRWCLRVVAALEQPGAATSLAWEDASPTSKHFHFFRTSTDLAQEFAHSSREECGGDPSIIRGRAKTAIVCAIPSIAARRRRPSGEACWPVLLNPDKAFARRRMAISAAARFPERLLPMR